MSTAGWRTTGVSLGVFGKHPGWNDHIEGLGLESEQLAELRRSLYLEGIASQVDSGAWRELDESDLLPGFAHTIFWGTRKGLVTARMWSSSDGKGRTSYPMIAAAHSVGMPFAWVRGVVLPALRAFERACRETETREDVMAALARLREDVAQGSSGGAGARDGAWGARWIRDHANEGGGIGREGLARIVHAFKKEAGALWSGTSGDQGAGGRGGVVRAPALGDQVTAAEAWIRLLGSGLRAGTPVMVVVPDDEAFSDLMIGTSEGSWYFGLRAGEGAIPTADRIPFVMDGETGNRVESWFGGDRQGLREEEDPGLWRFSGTSQRASGRGRMLSRLFRRG